MQAVAGWSGFVAKMSPIVLRRDPQHNPTHALIAGVHLAQKAHLAAPLTVSNRDGVAHLRNINSYKNFGRIHHDSSSCAEDRLGPTE